MPIPPPVPDNEKRQAVDALAGYAYQLYQTLLAWFSLQPGEVLFIEVAEDYAIASSTVLSATQVRATAANITLRTSHVAEALNSYWALRQKNTGQHVVYRYLTTSGTGKEQGLSFPDGLTGLQYWRRAANPGSDVQPVRDALLTLALSDELRSFVETASNDELRSQLISPVQWDCGEADLTRLKEMAALQSAWRATQAAQATAAEGKALVDPLIARVLTVACEKGTRQLTSIDLDEFIQERLMLRVSLTESGEVGQEYSTRRGFDFCNPLQRFRLSMRLLAILINAAAPKLQPCSWQQMRLLVQNYRQSSES